MVVERVMFTAEDGEVREGEGRGSEGGRGGDGREEGGGREGRGDPSARSIRCCGVPSS